MHYNKIQDIFWELLSDLGRENELDTVPEEIKKEVAICYASRAVRKLQKGVYDNILAKIQDWGFEVTPEEKEMLVKAKQDGMEHAIQLDRLVRESIRKSGEARAGDDLFKTSYERFSRYLKSAEERIKLISGLPEANENPKVSSVIAYLKDLSRLHPFRG